MRAVLEFNLPDESEEYRESINGGKYRIVLQEIDNHLRLKTKYCDLSDTEYQVYEDLREYLHQICIDNETTIW